MNRSAIAKLMTAGLVLSSCLGCTAGSGLYTMKINADNGLGCDEARSALNWGRSEAAFAIELNQTVPSRKVYSSDENPFKLDLPVRSMLQGVVNDFVASQLGSSSSKKQFTLRVSLASLSYDHHTDVGVEKPIVSLSLYAQLLDQSGRQLYDDIYQSGRVKGKRMPMAVFNAAYEERFKVEYYCVVSRAMSNVLNMAVVDAEQYRKGGAIP